jgi:Ca-activated chloride channel family protein
MKPAYVSFALSLLLLAPAKQGQQTIVIQGRVTDATRGVGIAGANVRIIGAQVSVGSVDSGHYRIVLAARFRGQEVELNVRAIGYKPATRTMKLVSDTNTVDFALQVDANRLDEVVVTGVTAGNSTITIRGTKSLPGVSSAVPQPASTPTPAFTIDGARQHIPGRNRPVDNTESYDRIVDNPFLGAATNPLSTFSVDVDRASYANIRRFISAGQRPPKDAVRIEELINYFTYEYRGPDDRHPFSVNTEVARAPWHPAHLLVRIALQARRLSPASLPPSNLVFLIDVSGSMDDPVKLPLVRESLKLLVRHLREQDRVAIVVYAGAAGLVLESTSGDRKEEILAALDRLRAGGSTAGGEGIRLAYDVARHYHLPNGNNRVILATDGDFNVGLSSDAEMERLIEEKREQGTFLSVLGFGTGNYKDSKMETLADKGNGNYAYVDDIIEARKVLVDEMAGTLLTLAKDVKLQVEFNPQRVESYRLIGYENRMLRKEDFDDDRKDAGEIGAGHSVTALYEVVPRGSRERSTTDEPLRYQTSTAAVGPVDELLYVKLRYKLPDAKTSRWLDHVVRASRPTEGSTDLRFAASVAAFGMILRDSEHRGFATLEDAIQLARGALGEDAGGYRADFVRLMETVQARSLLVARER